MTGQNKKKQPFLQKLAKEILAYSVELIEKYEKQQKEIQKYKISLEDYLFYNIAERLEELLSQHYKVARDTIKIIKASRVCHPNYCRIVAFARNATFDIQISPAYKKIYIWFGVITKSIVFRLP